METTTRKSNVYKEPTEKEKRHIYKIYELICSSHFSPAKKRALMTAALGYETWAWRVVGITEEAVRAIARNDFKKPSKTLARDHIVPRAETYKVIFEKRMPFKTWWNLVWENDKTRLVTVAEHYSQNISKVYKLDPKLNNFVCTDVAGWYQTKGREGELVRKLCKEKSISY